MTTIDLAPRFSVDDAHRIAAQHFGISGSIKPLPSERDQNFYVRAESGREYVLKIANAAEPRESLELQNSVMRWLNEHSDTVLAPGVIKGNSGETIIQVDGRDSAPYYVRLVTYLPGTMLADFKPHSAALLRDLGSRLGEMDAALKDYDHPASERELLWDPQNMEVVIAQHLGKIETPARRSLVENVVKRFETYVSPEIDGLRCSIVHNDANDYNVVVSDNRVAGLIDFGDLIKAPTICNLAVALAYIMLGKPDPIAAACQVVGAYHRAFPITDPELELLYDLARMRLCASVTLSAHHQKLNPENDYLSISEAPAWALLEALADLSPDFAHYAFRSACGLEPYPVSREIVRWLSENQAQFAPVVRPDPRVASLVVFDLSVGSTELGQVPTSDPVAFTTLLFNRMRDANADMGIGRYNEPRLLYAGEAFLQPGAERRALHIGLDIWMEAGTPVYAPLDGKVHSFFDNAADFDYGPTIILEHRAGDLSFYTLYGHLSADSLAGLQAGMMINKGQQFAKIGDFPTNGNWPPHLHFQVINDMLGREGEFPGVALPSQRDVWLSLCPDPNLIIGIPDEAFPSEAPTSSEILKVRREHVAPSLSISYREPLNIVRGAKQYLYDDNGQAYLDCVNNVPHVGHCHPRVVRAAQDQIAVLNTNTRYLHANLVEYAKRLTATLPEELSVCYFVCSGSEANDLAMRLARTYSGGSGVVVVDGAYHGNLSTLIDISPYKFDGPGGRGQPPHVRKALMPDGYRGPHQYDQPDAGKHYAAEVQAAVEDLAANHFPVAAFYAESLLSCGGQIVLPAGYLEEAYRHVRAAGGLCIADEVQIGFGRVGSHFWGFETQGVVPDIVTMGKPIGNGHPLAAVVTTPEVAAAFDNGMEYFNTFGGNPVSCAVGLAVLDVIQDEGLQARALRVGSHLKTGLEGLKAKYPIIGDVRGLGLFLGIEFVLDQETLEPAAEQASYIVNRMKDHRILLSTDGPLHNVIKIKPPLVFDEKNADFLVETLDSVLSEDFVRFDRI